MTRGCVGALIIRGVVLAPLGDARNACAVRWRGGRGVLVKGGRGIDFSWSTTSWTRAVTETAACGGAGGHGCAGGKKAWHEPF